MILVTGATGFLGCAVATALLARGDRVRVLARDPARAAKLRTLGADIAQGDLRDRASVAAACAGAKQVVHCAALSAPWGKRREFFASNVDGTRNVVDACLAHGIERIVHISSPSVTFDGTDQRLVREDVPYPARFTSVYSESKKLAEDVMRQAMARGLNAVILRPKAIFGPDDPTFVPRLLGAARAGRLRQIGNGTNLVDLTYVDNVVAAIVAALEAPRAMGNTYTITNGEHAALWPIIRRVIGAAGLNAELKRVPLPVALGAAFVMEQRAMLFGGEPALTRYAALILARTQTYDISAARRDLGYEPVVSLDEGIQRIIDSQVTRA